MTDERLLHYSSRPLSRIITRRRELRVDFKPKGLWVSVGPAWKEWCESEQFALTDLTIETEIVLRPRAKVLRLRTVADLDRFTSEYRKPLTPERPDLGMAIDWPAMSLEYDGIVIAPYQWQRRLDDRTCWYYGWDCASGCIWGATAISELVGSARAAA